jgi:predicted RNA-binding protein with TRAM domain
LTLIKNGEVAYTVEKSSCGKKGNMIITPEAIGQRVFVSDADIGTTIKTEIKGDRCSGCGKSHLGVIELPQHWIGKTVHVRPYEIFSV